MGDYANAGCTLLPDCRNPVGIQTADTEKGKLYPTGDFTDFFGADGSVIGFGARGINGTEPEVVRAEGFAGCRLTRGVGGEAEKNVGSEQTAGLGNSEVVLTKMTSGGPGGFHQVGVVVENQRQTAFTEQRNQTAGGGENGFLGEMFCPDLENAGSTGGELEGQVRPSFRRGIRRIEDGIEPGMLQGGAGLVGIQSRRHGSGSALDFFLEKPFEKMGGVFPAAEVLIPDNSLSQRNGGFDSPDDGFIQGALHPGNGGGAIWADGN